MKKIVALLTIVVLSSAANLQVFSQKTGKPMLRKAPLAKSETPAGVRLQSAAALTDGSGVYLHWQAEYEAQNTGFYVYRVGAKGTELVSETITPGGALKSSEAVVYGGIYSFYDPQGELGSNYYIESFSTESVRQIVGSVTAQYISDLKPVAGASGDELKVRAEEAAPVVENTALNLPKEVASEMEANAAPADPMMQRWVAAQPGVKISVRQEGIYRVSRTELQNAGFNVNAAGNLWQLWMDGKQQAISVGAGDSYIEFYGKGMDTPESATKVYYLIVGAQDGLRMGTTFLRNLSGVVNARSYNQSFVRKDRILYISSGILNGDEENFFGGTLIGTANPTNFTFNLTGVDFNVPKASFELTLQGISFSFHQVTVRINGELLDPLNWVGKTGGTGTYQIPTAFLREGTNTLQLQAPFITGDQSIFNSLKVNYFRKYEAIQNRLSFYTNSYRQTSISGFASSNIRVFDLTNPDSPSLLTNLSIQENNGNFSVVMPSNRGRLVFATENSALLSADSIVQNVPSTLSTPTHNGELLIVSYKDWMTQANDWANYRRSQGMTVEVVDIEDILDEFGYGSTSTAAMTQFFQYAKNNWQTPPNYILLLGDAVYDYRNYENRAFQNFVPTKRADTLYQETGSDEALSDFNSDGLAEIAIGRIPARNPADVTRALNKTMTFESTVATAFSRGAVFAFDEPRGYDFEQLSRDLANELPASMPKNFIGRLETDSRSRLLADLNTGRYLLNYSGHGSFGSWQSGFLLGTDAANMTNAPNYTMFFMLTCFNGYFLSTTNDGMGELLLKSQTGGAVLVWASSGETTPDIQRIMATRFYNQLNVSSMNKIGDLVKDAKASLNVGRDVRLSWALLGDPTLRVK